MRIRTVIAALFATLAAATPAGAALVINNGDPNGGGTHAVAPALDGNSVFVGALDCAYAGRFDLGSRSFKPLAGPGGELGCDAGQGVYSMVQGLDGKIYFTLFGANKIGRVNADGTGLQTIDAGGTHPLDITIGPDAKIWFTLNGSGGTGGKVGRVDPASFALVEAPVPVPGDVQDPRGIVSASDGKLYVMGGETGKLYKVTPAAPPTIEAVVTGLNGPSYGQVGPNGKIWFTLFEGKGVRTYTPGVPGVATVFDLTDASPFDVAFGEDGKAYVTLPDVNRILQFAPGADAPFTQLGLPAGSSAHFIAASSNGNLFSAVKGPAISTLVEIVPDVPPRTSTGAPTQVGATSAAVSVAVNPRGAATSAKVLFGTTAFLGSTSTDVQVGTADSSQTVSVPLSGLAPQTTYFYRAEATNRWGTTVGEVRSFTTPVAPDPDGDGDGARASVDCDDASAAVRPGALEVVGDGIDQDCSGADLRVAKTSLSVKFRVKRGRTQVSRLALLRVPSGARIELRCTSRRKGCAFSKRTKRITKTTRRVNLVSAFKRRRLKSGATIELHFSLPGYATKVVRYKTTSRRKPRATKLCVAPGSSRPQRCAGA